MTPEGPVFLFDLDDSFVSVNSFHLLVRRLVLPTVLRRRGVPLATRVSLALATGLRRAGLLSRPAYKQRIQRFLADRPLDDFVDLLQRHVDPEMADVVRRARSDGHPTVLTTAALAEYAVLFGRRQGFDLVVATEPAHDGWQENLGPVKRDRTLAAVAAAGWDGRDLVLFADHEDDLPLAERCAAVFWVSRGPTGTRATPSVGEIFAPAGVAAWLDRARNA
jgi:phosphoserine phosphatase